MALRSDFRPALEWSEEAARIWWTWGSGSDAPFPGVERAWHCFVAQFVGLDVADALENGLACEVTAVANNVARVVRTISRVVYYLVYRRTSFIRLATRSRIRIIPRPESRSLRGAGAILAPPARTRGVGHTAAMTT